MSEFKTLRAWAAAMSLVGGIGMVLAVVGTIVWAVEVEGFWATLGVLFLGAPLVLFLATWPFALGQMMRALADMGDAVNR